MLLESNVKNSTCYFLKKNFLTKLSLLTLSKKKKKINNAEYCVHSDYTPLNQKKKKKIINSFVILPALKQQSLKIDRHSSLIRTVIFFP